MAGDREGCGEQDIAPWAVPGTRISVGKYTCTVRYVGLIDGQKGLWVGLEWDDGSRGKHDGSHEGKRYFTCQRQGEARATFVRYAKLVEHGIGFGRSIDAAIYERYKTMEPSVREVVGAEEAALTAQCDGCLSQAGLSGMMISGLEVTPLVKSFMRNVVSLDLSDNLISSWRDVVALVSSLENLRMLDLSNNVVDFVESGGSQCTNIETLALNNCLIEDCKALGCIDSAFPNLKELYLYNNNLWNSLSKDNWESRCTWSFCELERMDLGCNSIESWSIVARSFGHIPKLRSLLLEGNHIAHIDIRSTVGKGFFPRLEHLNVGGNAISEWSSIQQLSCLESLRELRFSRNPVCKDDPLRDRIQAIGRIRGLTWVNGSEVSCTERRDGELAFLRRLDTFVPSTMGYDSLLEERIQYLEKQYNVERNSSGRIDGATSLGSGMIHMQVSYGSKMLAKRIPRSLTVNKLKIIIQKLTGVKAQDQVLILRRGEDGQGSGPEEVISAEGTRELSYFCTADWGGWHIRVEEDDAHSQLIKTHEQEARMQSQEEDMKVIRAEEKRLMSMQTRINNGNRLSGSSECSLQHI